MDYSKSKFSYFLSGPRVEVPESVDSCEAKGQVFVITVGVGDQLGFSH